MSKQQDQESMSRLVIEAIDAEFIREGLEKGIPENITRQHLAENRQMLDRYEELLAAGYTEDQIDALWEGKTSQEILAGAGANGASP